MGLIEKAKEYVEEKIENIPKPEATLEGMKLDGVGWDGVSYTATLAIMNPYPNSIPLCDAAYILKSDARVILTGNMPDPGDLEGKHKITKLEMGLKVPHSVVMSLVRDIWADWDIDYELEVILTIDVPIIGSFEIRLSHTGEIKLPTISSFWRAGDDDEKGKDKDNDKDKDKNKDKNEEDDNKSKDNKPDEEEEEKNERNIPFLSSLLSRDESDDENDKDGDDQQYKHKKWDKDEKEDEKGAFKFSISLGGSGSDDEKDKDKDKDYTVKNNDHK